LTRLEPENKKNNEVTETQNTPQTPISQTQTILSKEEIHSVVRDFVLAYIKGDATINFPSVDEYMKSSEKEGQKLDFKTARQKELAVNAQFANLVSIVAGNKPSTTQELEHSVSELFYLILLGRTTDRIKGTFGQRDNLESRLCRLEEEIVAMNEQIQQLIIWYRSMLQTRS
jgi:hypothetical protein